MPLRLLTALSARNLSRHRRRTVTLLVAICIAVSGVILLNAFLRGMQADMRDSAVENLSGHLKILAPGYRDDPGIDKRFDVPAGWRDALPGEVLEGWAPRLRVPAVIMSERETRGAQLVGIDPAREDISFLGDVPVAGDALTGPDDNRILVGRAMAEQLETAAGYRLVIMAQGADGGTREMGFRVAGVYDAEGTALEKAYVFAGLAFMQSMLGDDGVTEVSVRFAGHPQPDPLVAAVQARVPGLEVYSWQQLDPQNAAMFALADVGIYIWFGVMMGALIFGLVNVLVTAVLERTREIGMLRALGMRRGAVVAQVVLESSLMMSLGVLAGLGLGAALVVWLGGGIDLSRWAQGAELAGMSTVLVPRLLPGDVALITVMSLTFGVLASLYPAWRAVKITPLEALRR
ncbi:MAG: ABC transporter permease [Pseudomonadota bacterium]